VLYSRLLKMASEKAGSRFTDWWVPDLNLPVAEMLPTNYVQSSAVRLEIYGRVARCRSGDDLNDVEEEIARRFGRLPHDAREFFAAARLRLECKRRGIVRMDAGPEAVAGTFLPGRLRKWKTKSLKRDEDRVIYADEGTKDPFERVNDFPERLDVN
jgi:transcription-repair coupling factor (superfamily II helicase)